MGLKKHDIQKFITETSNDIFNTLRISAQLHSMVLGGGQGESLPDRLTMRTGATLRALVGSGNDGTSVARSDVVADGFKITYGVRLPWAAKHELGGTFPVQPGNRRFFWAKYFHTTDPKEKLKWKMMALFAKSLKYPARPFLLPTVTNSDTIAKIAEHLYDYLGDIIIFNYQLMINDNKAGSSFKRVVKY